MEQLLDSLEDPGSAVDQPCSSSDPGHIHLTNSDLNPNMEDVIKVLSDLDEDFVQSVSSGTASHHHHLNSVHDVSHLVDKDSLAEEKLEELKQQQDAIEER